MSTHTSPSRKHIRPSSGNTSESTHWRKDLRSSTQSGMRTLSSITTVLMTRPLVCPGFAKEAYPVAVKYPLDRLFLIAPLPQQIRHSLQVRDGIEVARRLL